MLYKFYQSSQYGLLEKWNWYSTLLLQYLFIKTLLGEVRNPKYKQKRLCEQMRETRIQNVTSTYVYKS
jgi:hypothetical protein